MAEQTINVARQETLENIDNKIDTLDTVTDNIYSKVDTEVTAIKTKTDLIGTTGDTGGSATSGTIMGKLNALLTSWTSTRAGYVDRLANGTYGLDKIKADTTTNNTGSKTGILSQKLSYLISLLENTTYGLSAIKTAINNNSSSSNSVIKSIQRGSTSIGYQKQVATATINAVNMNKAFLITTGFIDANTESNSPQTYRAEITNSTTLTFNCAYYADGIISWQVIEFV